MLFKYSSLCSNINSERKNCIIDILSQNHIDYKIKAKMPFRMHSFNSSKIAGIGRTSKSYDVQYTIMVQKDDLEFALKLIK